MSSRRTRPWSVSIFILACALAAPAELVSQCGVTMQTTYTFGGTFIRITKTLSASGNCPTTGGMNAFGCAESPGQLSATMLIASAFTATTNPFCNWVCNCGPSPYSAVAHSINTSDGLPVELMDFGIEDEVAAESVEESRGGAEHEAAVR